MKKIHVITALLLLTIMLTGCEEFLTRNPISSSSPNTFWNAKEDANLWLAGTYDKLQGVIKYGALDWGEARSDNFNRNGVGTRQDKVLGNALVGGDADLARLTSWSQIYTVISRCNYGMTYLPRMIENNTDAGIEMYKDQLGQYHGIRAMMYFYAIRIWGRVPIVGDVPIESLNQNLYFSRSPIDSVKAVILSDIDKSITNLNVDNKKYYFSLAAAYALKADVHMWFKEYDLAEVAIEKLESLKYHSWITNKEDWKKIFTDPETSTETIFTIFYDQLQDNGGNGIGIMLGSTSHQSEYSVSQDIHKALADRNIIDFDIRWQDCFDTITFSTSSTPYLQVQFGKYAPWSATLPRVGTSKKGGFVFEPAFMSNIKTPIYRYADIMLMKAEIYFYKGEYQKALNIVNKVRARVGYFVEAYLSDFGEDFDAEVFECIMTERRLELAGEGKRWFDLLRAGKEDLVYFHKIMGPVMAARNGVDFNGINEGRILFPIEATVFSSNPKLRGDQNPPYSE